MILHTKRRRLMLRSSTQTNDKSTTQPENSKPLLISAPELAKILGISARSVWRLLSAGKLPAPVRLGGAVRWRRSDVLAWIEQGCPPDSTSSDQRN
ncbi:MAG: helix-turn-helix transcriptional regulator [Pirellulaceae bacterium]